MGHSNTGMAIALGELAVEARGPRHVAAGSFEVARPIVFEPDLAAAVTGADGVRHIARLQESRRVGWLPRGTYRIELALPGALPAGEVQVEIEASHHHGLARHPAGSHASRHRVGAATVARDEPMGWLVEAVPPTPALASLAWSRGHDDWFFRHFDHAAPTVTSYLLADSPLLKGRILDVGCGDGITDLGIALRTGCEELIGLDPFRQWERLPGIVRDNHLPEDAIPENLRFVADDANFLPFPDDSFDVIVSWGSIEHMAGGYLQALREMKRVLRPDGLAMVAPGLYYSNIGHHLTEFSQEPFFHLKRSREEIRRMVLETPPRYIDRSGEFSSNEQFWQWFTELNPITVSRFEQEMRALEFRPWRIALRTDGLVEYTPEIEHYPIQDLANIELYSSWINRKKACGGR